MRFLAYCLPAMIALASGSLGLLKIGLNTGGSPDYLPLVEFYVCLLVLVTTPLYSVMIASDAVANESHEVRERNRLQHKQSFWDYWTPACLGNGAIALLAMLVGFCKPLYLLLIASVPF